MLRSWQYVPRLLSRIPQLVAQHVSDGEIRLLQRYSLAAALFFGAVAVTSYATLPGALAEGCQLFRVYLQILKISYFLGVIAVFATFGADVIALGTAHQQDRTKGVSLFGHIAWSSLGLLLYIIILVFAIVWPFSVLFTGLDAIAAECRGLLR